VKSALAFLVTWLLPLSAVAQTGASSLPLDEALAVAEAKSEQVAIARAGVTRSEGDVMRSRAERFPQLALSASYDRSLASEFDKLFERTTGDDGSDFGDLPFGRKNTWRVNLAFSQNLFSSGRIAAQEAIARAGRTNAEIALASARAQLALDVVRAYYDAVLSDRLVAIAEATYQQADAAFRQTELSFRAGVQPEFELLRAQVARDTQRPALVRRRSDRDLAYLRLKQLLELPAGAQLVLTTRLDGDTLPAPAPFVAAAAAGQAPPPDIARAPVRQAETTLHVREAAIDVARAARRPNVSLTSQYGRVTYPSAFFPDFTDFRTNWTVGVVAQMPILTGGRLRGDEIVARADRAEADARLQQARELAELDTRSAYEEMAAARAAWEASGGTVTQAVRAYEIAELRYRQGISTQLELTDSRLLLEQAQANRAQAARDLQIARARVALLPDLPLGTLPGSAAPSTIAPPPAPAGPRVPAAPTVRAAQAAGGPTP
jgi:outer membrane protein TolC